VDTLFVVVLKNDKVCCIVDNVVRIGASIFTPVFHERRWRDSCQDWNKMESEEYM